MTWRRTPSALSCRTVARLLQAYLDGELLDTRAVLLANHLGACLRCSREARAYRHLKARLAGLTNPPDPHQVERLRTFTHDLATNGLA